MYVRAEFKSEVSHYWVGPAPGRLGIRRRTGSWTRVARDELNLGLMVGLWKWIFEKSPSRSHPKIWKNTSPIALTHTARKSYPSAFQNTKIFWKNRNSFGDIAILSWTIFGNFWFSAEYWPNIQGISPKSDRNLGKWMWTRETPKWKWTKKLCANFLKLPIIARTWDFVYDILMYFYVPKK